MNIYAYLTFNGNCREAMNFYQQCIGGTLQLQTVGETPLAAQLPGQMKNCILHATLKNGALLLMGSDMVSDNGLQRGNAVSLCLLCSSEEELRTRYARLSENGMATHPVEKTFWGALLGGLTDRYGNTWLLNYEPETT